MIQYYVMDTFCPLLMTSSSGDLETICINKVSNTATGLSG